MAMRKGTAALLFALLLLGPLAAGGCTAACRVAERPSPYLLLAVPARPATALPAEPSPDGLPDAGPLTLADFVEVALRRNPELRIAEARVEEAQGRFLQAGLYPNPMVGWQANDVGARDNRAGKQGITLTQDIVTAGKLDIAQAAAGQGVAAADWQAVTRWYEVMAKLRAAYYDALTAQRAVQVNDELTRIAENAFLTAEKFERAGAGNRPDVLRAQVELEQMRNRLEVARRQAEARWRLLAAAAGLDELPQRPLAGRLEDTVGDYDYAALRSAILANHSDLQAARAAVAEADLLLRRAEVEVVPDVQLYAQPQYMFDEQSAGAQAGITITLPVFNRNQGNIRAARAELAKAHETLRQTELRLLANLAAAYQRYQAARLLVRNIAELILPKAQESLRLILLGYERGDEKFDYTAVLQAQNILAQVRMGYVEALGDLQTAATDLEALLQRPGGTFFRAPAAAADKP
jgi:cobalt-zinc-cadmium efflux system outer membrane protein